MTHFPHEISGSRLHVAGRGRNPIIATLMVGCMLAMPALNASAQTSSDTEAAAAKASKPKSGDEAPANKAEKNLDPKGREGSMTSGRINEIITRLDDKVQVPRPGMWQFKVSNTNGQN